MVLLWKQSGKVPFAGRETELRGLLKFCEDERQILWWSVTGQGGSGISRLAYEFYQLYSTTPDWIPYLVNKDFWEHTSQIRNYDSKGVNLLLIVDYASVVGRKIGSWMAALDLKRKVLTGKI